MVFINETKEVTLAGATYQITLDSGVYVVHATATGSVITLPAISTSGMRYRIFNAYDSTFSLTINTTGPLINGVSSVSIDQNSQIDIISTNSVWQTIVPETIEPCKCYFGNGASGDVTISTTVTLTRDTYYNNLTVASSGNLITGGYRVFVKETLTLTGQINNNGMNGSTAISPLIAQGGTGATAGTLGGGGNGGNGGSVFGGIAQRGSSGVSVNPVYSPGGTFFNGGNGASTTFGGGIGGTATSNTINNGGNTWLSTCANLINGRNAAGIRLVGGAGGGGGDAVSTNSSTGGAGGGGGGVIMIAAKTITGSGTISAKGGNGGLGISGVSGGGGGGGGGLILLITTGITPTLNVSGGLGATSSSQSGQPGQPGQTVVMIC